MVEWSRGGAGARRRERGGVLWNGEITEIVIEQSIRWRK